jgi:transcriptional regulator with XRE-family HTH domain
MAMFATILKRDRIRNGMTQAQVARHLGISLAEYRAVESEEQSATLAIYEKTVELFGWPSAYVALAGRSPTARPVQARCGG